MAVKKYEYDVVIAYRTYPGTKPSRQRALFPDDKYKLEQACLKSLKDSLGSLKFKIWALLDNCPPIWEDLFKTYFNEKELKIINLKSAGEIGSIKRAITVLLKQEYSDVVYMAEDDYFYLPNQFEKMIKFLITNPDVDFITPYDHLDYYSYGLHDYQSTIKNFAGKHWRTVASTCNTFLTTKKKMYEVKNLFLKSYTAKNFFTKDFILKNSLLKRLFWDFIDYSMDNNVWLSLTKKNVFHLFKILKYRVNDRSVFSTFFRAWRYNWKQILFGKRWKLWCPIPSIATHLEAPFLAPNIDWKKEFKKTS